jgi:hypothetical protein
MTLDKGRRQRARRKIRPGHVIAALAACGALVLPAAVATQAHAQVSAAGGPCTTDCNAPQRGGIWLG